MADPPNTTNAINAYVDDLLRRARDDARTERQGQARQASMPGAVASVVNGLTFGFGDELVAGARSTFGSTPYETALGQERASRADYAERHPYLAAGAELAGAAPTMLIPMSWWGRAAQGANRIRSAATAGLVAGGAQGALQGFGEGEGGFGQRLVGAGVGAAVGAPLGAAGGVVAEAAAPVVRGTVERLRTTFTPSGNAERVLARTATADNPAPGAVGQALEGAARQADDFAAASMPATGRTAAEALGPNSRTALETLAQQPGEAMATASRQLEQRAAGRMDRIDQGLRETFGDHADAWTARQAAYERRSADATPLYERAFATAQPLDAIDLQLLRQIPEQALREARQRALLRGERLSFTPQFDDQGRLIIDPGRIPTARDMHIIKTGLDTMIENGTDAVTGRVSGLAHDAMGVRNSIRGRLDALTPDGQGGSLYQQARRTWAGESANIDAQRLGLRFFDEPPAALRAALADMGQVERDYFLQGAMNTLRQRLGDVRVTGTQNPVNAIFGSNNQRASLQVLTEAMGLPPGEALQRFGMLSQFLNAENAGHAVEGTVLRNSATARRQAMGQALGTSGAALGGSGLAYAFGHDPVQGALLGAGLGAAGSGGRALWQRGMAQQNDALARLLMTTAPDDMRSMGRRLEAIRLSQQNVPVGTRAGVVGGSVAGGGPAQDELRRGLLDY